MPDLITARGLRIALAASSLFILLAILVIPYAGIQADEALFTGPLFPHIKKDLPLPLLPRHMPLMVMTYIGTLKTLVYWPIFRIFGTGVWALRLPVALFGAATIFLFFHLARASGGATVAAIGVFLLASDPSFLLTSTFDWGPVALEHLLLVTGCWLLYRFTTQGRVWQLSAGFFCWGLALWNKAIFIWALSGLIAGGVLVFWPEIKRCLKPRLILAAAAGFLCGALPLVVYNLSHANATVKENVHLDFKSVPAKWIQVEYAANGNSLFGYIAGEDWWPNPKAPQSLSGRAALWIRDHLGEHRITGFYYLFGILLLAAPWWWKSRAARFSLVFMTVAWLLMALTHDAGTSVHHVILLWPFPILFAAIALASLPWRPIAWTAAALMIAMNLLVVNQYVAQFERNGAGDFFSDALFPLSSAIDRSYPDPNIYVIDWGLFENLNLLQEGRLNFRIAIGPVRSDSPSADELSEIQAMLRDPHAVVLAHVRTREVFPGVGAHLDKAANALGYRRGVVQTIPDSNGRLVFELVQFVPNS